MTALQRALLLLLVLIFLGWLLFLGEREEGGGKIGAVNERLELIGYFNNIEEEINGRMLVGVLENGYYVYVSQPQRIRVVDRLTGKDANIPFKIYATYKGKRIELLKPYTWKDWILHIRTPYEIIESNVPLVGVYTGWYVGKYYELNEGCILMKRWEDINVPLLLSPGYGDPDGNIVCKEGCEDPAIIEFNGVGWVSIGDLRGFSYFERAEGRVEVCGCKRVKIYVDGYRPWVGEVCNGDRIKLNLVSLQEKEYLKGNYVFLDSTGALTSIGDFTAPPGNYRVFRPFPLMEVNKSLKMVEINGWVGYKFVNMAPLYTIFWNRGYFYTIGNGYIPVEGFICKDGVCRSVGKGIPVLAMGNCTIYWDGSINTQCPALEVEP